MDFGKQQYCMKKVLISVREFSRRIGCSDVAVHKAIKSGKIVKGVSKGKNGWPVINPDIALAEWGKNYDPSYASHDAIRSAFEGGVKPTPKPKKEKPTETETESAPPPRAPEQIGAHDSGSMAAAKRAQAIFKAKIMEIELKEKQSKVVDKGQVYMALFEAGKEVKASIMSVPDRVIDAIFSAPSRNEAHTILTKALIEALDTMADIQNNNILDR